MRNHVKALLTAAALFCLVPAAAFAAITDFTQDFESLNQSSTTALSADGWLYWVTVFEAGSDDYMYGYGGGAPNTDSPVGIDRIVVGEGGTEQGSQQLSVFSDYNNQTEQTAGNLLNTNVYKEFSIEAEDVGKECSFSFQAKMGNLTAPSTATAFIKTLNPADNYSVTNHVIEDMTSITTDWNGWTLQLTIDSGLVGQIFQVGFSNDATNNVASAIFYDNVVLDTDGGTAPTGMTAYSQDFESLNAASTTALGDDGWLYYANVAADVPYSYGPGPAPNNPSAPAFCTITTGEGGAEQGSQQMSVFSDYENAGAHTAGDVIESIVYREQTVGTADVGKTWVFEFQAKMPAVGGVTSPSTAEAFIKTLNPSAGYAMTNYITQDMTAVSTTWGGWSLELTIDSGLVGQLFQIGFANTATSYNASAVIYDNVVLRVDDSSPVPDGMIALGATLHQNYPNPFNPLTRIEFSLETSSLVDLTVYDLSGRMVSQLVHDTMPAGDHFVTWNGRTAAGTPAPAGLYHYVMKTAAGQASRSMVLLK